MSSTNIQPTLPVDSQRLRSLRSRWRFYLFFGMNWLVMIMAGGASLIIALQQRQALIQLHEVVASRTIIAVQSAVSDTQRSLTYAGQTFSPETVSVQDLDRLRAAHPIVRSVRVVNVDGYPVIAAPAATRNSPAATASDAPATVTVQAPTGDGQIIAELDSALLWSAAVDGAMGDDGYAVLVDEAGAVLAAPPDLDRAADRNPVEFAPIERARDGQSALRVYRGLEGKWVIGRAERLPDDDMFVLTETPLAAIAPAALGGAALWGLALLAAAAAGETLLRRMTNTVLAPFAILRQGARAVSRGDYQYRVRLPSGTEREIAELGAAFNAMIARLQENQRQIDAYTHEMEGVVELRARELSRKAMQLEVAADVSTKIATILDPGALIEEVICLIQDRFKVYHAQILLVEDESKTLRPVDERQATSTGTIRLQNADHDMLAWAARYGETVYAPDALADERYRRSPARPASRCALAIPLVFGGQAIGVLSLESDHQDAFPRDEIAVLESLANEIAISIHNARLFDALERSNRELAQATLQASQTHLLKSRFLLNASHKLRTPLNAIIGYSETILSGVYGKIPDKALDRQRRILENGRMLQALIEDMLDLSSIETGYMELKLTWIALPPLLEEVMNAAHALHQTAYGDHDLTLKITIDDDLPPVWADIDRLRYVLMSLMSNAVKFTPAGEVSMAAWADESAVYMAVRDTGPGIPKEELAYLFEPFQHQRGSTACDGKGTGLGLPVSRLLALRHGGDLTVQSTLHQGSTFTLRLPRRPNGAPSPP